MAKRSYPLSELYRLLEPGPVVLVTTARKGRANIMTSLECRVADTRLVNRYNFFVLEGFRHGSTPPSKIRRRCTIAEKACSWWPARRSGCARG
jgi:hypothetical protein